MNQAQEDLLAIVARFHAARAAWLASGDDDLYGEPLGAAAALRDAERALADRQANGIAEVLAKLGIVARYLQDEAVCGGNARQLLESAMSDLTRLTLKATPCGRAPD